MKNRKNSQKQPVVLIVDDTIENLKVLGNILKEQNYKIAIARNGNQALTIANEINPDLILKCFQEP